MNKKVSFISIFFLLLLQLPTFSDAKPAFDHSLWDSALKQYVSPEGSVNYKAWKTNQTSLKKYIVQLQAPTRKEVESWSTEEQMAFYINAYNAFTIQVILENYPVKSIRKIVKWRGLKKVEVWDHWEFPLLHETHNLTWIEHKVLRPVFKDARIHAAINCASVSCPKLQRFAFTGNDLQNQLDQSTREFVNDISKNHFYMDKDGDAQAEISKIFKWFTEDFKPGVLKWIAQWTNDKNKKVLSNPDVDVSHLDYNWDLNE